MLIKFDGSVGFQGNPIEVQCKFPAARGTSASFNEHPQDYTDISSNSNANLPRPAANLPRPAASFNENPQDPTQPNSNANLPRPAANLSRPEASFDDNP